MADAGKNSMWSHLSEKSGSAVTSILGPDYSYSDHIKPPSSMGVGSSLLDLYVLLSIFKVSS
jgi:hypothetical protein